MPDGIPNSRLEAYRAAQMAAKLRLEARQLSKQPARRSDAAKRMVALEVAAMEHQKASDVAFARMHGRAA